MQRLPFQKFRPRPSFLLQQVTFAFITGFIVFSIFSMWQQSVFVERSGVQSNEKYWVFFFGPLLLVMFLTFWMFQYKESFPLVIKDEQFDDSFEVSPRDTIVIEPIYSRKSDAILISLRYDCDWEPQIKSFKIYFSGPPVSFVSYNLELRDERGTVLNSSTFRHIDDSGEVSPTKPRWKHQEFSMLENANAYSLHIRPLFDKENLLRFGQKLDFEHLQITLQVKLSFGTRWRDRHLISEETASLSQARGEVRSFS